MRKVQGGFTLIELIIVIVILGILAAVALPRFVNLGQSARVAAVNALAGGIRSGSAVAHSAALAANVVNGSVTLEGQSITIVNGYPAATNAGIGAAISDYTGFTSDNAGKFTKDGAATPANCSVTYTAAPANGAATVATDTTGC